MRTNALVRNPFLLSQIPAPLQAAGYSGVVYGVLANDPAFVSALGNRVHQPPYKGPPRAPVLYMKPRNTLAPSGSAVSVPATPGEFEVGASLGLVIGRTACRLSESSALSHVCGLVAVTDLSIPHDNFYRPALRLKARDGSCLISPFSTPLDAIDDPDSLEITVRIDAEVAQVTSTQGMVRPVSKLLAEVTEFMTLQPGDILLLGTRVGAPRVRAGQKLAVAIAGIAPVEATVQEESE